DLRIDNRSSFLDAFNTCMPAGIRIDDVRIGRHRSEGKNTIGSLYWGSTYQVFVRDKKDLSRLGQYLVSERPHETVAIDNDKSLIEITLNDARGGERNIARLIEKALDSDK
ncbi:MAG TPA: hypothetical protein DIT55_07015, partial [Spirochaetaceae bacterium]|nr:hypothetical protein [Spirochaetaceae bacterium]